MIIELSVMIRFPTVIVFYDRFYDAQNTILCVVWESELYSMLLNDVCSELIFDVYEMYSLGQKIRDC